MTSFTLEHSWELVEVSPGVAYRFPALLSPHLRCSFAGPAMYLWTVKTSESLQSVYIGETEDLPRRLRGYLNPGTTQFTNQRMNAHLLDEVRSDHTPELSRLRFEPFSFADTVFSESDLEIAAVRHFLEGIFEATFRKAGFSVLNA